MRVTVESTEYQISRTRYDPLGLFGESFTDDYVRGFYAGMSHLAGSFVLVPYRGELDPRLKSHPDHHLAGGTYPTRVVRDGR